MKRLLGAMFVVGMLGACSLFGGPPRPSGFDGWFHLDRPERATSIQFDNTEIAEVRDYGCSGNLNVNTSWQSDGTGILLTTWASNPPRFTADAGQLEAHPGMYSPTETETWLPGASCLVCPVGDAGYAIACDTPGVLDGGT